MNKKIINKNNRISDNEKMDEGVTGNSHDIFTANSSTHTSSFLIYKALKNSDNRIIRRFKVEFPSEGCLVSDNNTILIAEANEEIDKNTIDKKSDYEEVSKLLRSARRAIKNILYTDTELARLNPRIRSSACKYGSRFELKGCNLLVQTREVDYHMNTIIRKKGGIVEKE